MVSSISCFPFYYPGNTLHNHILLKYNFDVKTILYLLWEKTNKNNNAGINCDRQVQVIPEKESFIYLFIYSLNDKHQDYRSNVNNSSVNEIITYETTAMKQQPRALLSKDICEWIIDYI